MKRRSTGDSKDEAKKKSDRSLYRAPGGKYSSNISRKFQFACWCFHEKLTRVALGTKEWLVFFNGQSKQSSVLTKSCDRTLSVILKYALLPFDLWLLWNSDEGPATDLVEKNFPLSCPGRCGVFVVLILPGSCVIGGTVNHSSC